MKLLLKRLLLAAAAFLLVLGGLLIYAHYFEPYRLDVTKKELKLPGWNPALNGFRVVAVSDIHGGSHTMTEEKLRFISEQVNAQNPDIVVLLGDFVSETRGRGSALRMPMETIAENIKGMRAKYGVYAVIGNHDWWYDEKNVRGELERVGFKVLENEAASFQANNQTVRVLGVEDFWKRRRADIAPALGEIEPKQNILAITHNPDTFDLTPDSISLLIAGHTHGGQVLLPFIGAPVPVAKREYMAGHVVKDGRNLFVTVGAATTSVPVRFRVPPEIAVLTLSAQ